MEALDLDLVKSLRVLARNGEPPSAMLRRVLAHLLAGRTPDQLTADDRINLVGYFTAAFCFQEGQGSPIFGWYPDGRGELKDADIDRIMSRRIEKTCTDWQSVGG
jgi:hypothetical protein